MEDFLMRYWPNAISTALFTGFFSLCLWIINSAQVGKQAQEHVKRELREEDPGLSSNDPQKPRRSL